MDLSPAPFGAALRRRKQRSAQAIALLLTRLSLQAFSQGLFQGCESACQVMGLRGLMQVWCAGSQLRSFRPHHALRVEEIGVALRYVSRLRCVSLIFCFEGMFG